MGAKKTKMSQKDNQDWLLLPHPGIFEKIMLMVGLDNMESLDNCRQVCRSWNAMIMNNIWENPTKKWGTVIQRRIERRWDIQNYYPSERMIARAKLLGKQRIKFFFCRNIIFLETRGILTLDGFESLLAKQVGGMTKIMFSASLASLDSLALWRSSG